MTFRSPNERYSPQALKRPSAHATAMRKKTTAGARGDRSFCVACSTTDMFFLLGAQLRLYTPEMPKLTIYHNSRCSKSRETLALIETAGKDVTIVNYLESPPSPAELKGLLAQLGMKAADLVRTKEARYAELGLEGKAPSEKEW